MKTKILALLFVLFGFAAGAQNLLNPSFDSVYFGGIDRLYEWVTADGFRMHAGSTGDTVNALQPNTFYDASGLAFSALFWMNNQYASSSISIAATELINRPTWFKEDGSVYESFVINGNHLYTDASGYPDLSRCGIPFAARPTKLTGFYRFTDSTATLNNFGKCVILLRKWNAAQHKSDTIAFTISAAHLNPQAAVTPFEIPINYMSTDVPDTLMVAFFAATNTQNPSVLWLDNLQFIYSGFSLAEDEKSNFTLYPNPTTGSVFLKNVPQTPTDFAVYNAAGNVVKTGKALHEINLNDLPSGCYTLKMQLPNGSACSRQIIKR